MISHEIDIRKMENFFRGWTIEMRHKKGIFEVRDVPGLADALEACMQKVLAAPERKPKEPIEKLIERSSLGTPAAKALRESAPKDMVDATLRRSDELSTNPSAPPTHMKVTYGDEKSLRSLCGAVYGEKGKYAETSEGVTCLRCVRMLQKSTHPNSQ